MIPSRRNCYQLTFNMWRSNPKKSDTNIVMTVVSFDRLMKLSSCTWARVSRSLQFFDWKAITNSSCHLRENQNISNKSRYSIIQHPKVHYLLALPYFSFLSYNISCCHVIPIVIALYHIICSVGYQFLRKSGCFCQGTFSKTITLLYKANIFIDCHFWGLIKDSSSKKGRNLISFSF